MNVVEVETCEGCGAEAEKGSLIRDSVDSSQLRCQNCIAPDKKPRKPRKRKEKPVIAAIDITGVPETVISRVPEPEIPIDFDALRKDAEAFAHECGLDQVRVDGPERETYPRFGYGYVFQITELSGKQRRATARYTCYGLRNYWSMDSLVTG
jgi:hypothetical protein